jgi:hypothetical protein
LCGAGRMRPPKCAKHEIAVNQSLTADCRMMRMRAGICIREIRAIRGKNEPVQLRRCDFGTGIRKTGGMDGPKKLGAKRLQQTSPSGLRSSVFHRKKNAPAAFKITKLHVRAAPGQCAKFDPLGLVLKERTV